MRAAVQAERVALVAVVALAAGLRFLALGHAYEPDEFANLMHAPTLWQVITDPESGVNPPLLRALFGVPFAEPDTLRFGRWFTWACSVASVPLGGLLARRLTGSALAGLAAAWMIATLPYGVHMGARFRSYAPFCATLALHLLALEAWVRARTQGHTSRSQELTLVTTAALLPQWHYFGIPILLGLGAAGLTSAHLRLLALRYVPAALLVAPLGLLGLAETGARVPHDQPLLDLFRQLLAFDLGTDRRVLDGLLRHLPALAFGDATFGPAAAVTAAWFGAALLLLPRLPLATRLVAAAALAVLAGAAAFAQVQLVRTPTLLYLATATLPLIACVPALAPTTWQRAAATVLLVASMGVSLPWNLNKTLHHQPYEGPRRLAATWTSFDAARAGGDVITWPQYTAVAMFFYLEGHHLRWLDKHPEAEAPDGGFLHEGVAFRSIVDWDAAHPPRGLVVAFRDPPQGFAAGCTPVQSERAFHVWSCP